MYDTGNVDFLAAACNPNRTIDTAVVLTFPDSSVSLNTDDVVSYKATFASTGGKAFAPGSFVASILELSLMADSTRVSQIDFKTATINSLSLSTSIKVHKEMVSVPIGVFYIESDGVDTGNDGYVGIKATDLPPVLYTEFNSNTMTLPCTVQDFLDKLADETGLTVVSDDFPNLSVELIESFAMTTTYREAFMYIAETLGAYAHMDRNGRVHLTRLFAGLADLGCVLDDNYLFSVKVQESSVKPFQHIGIKADKDDLGVTQDVEGVSSGRRYDIIANPLTYGHSEDFLAGLVSPLEFTEFFPSTISFQGRPDLDTGDVLSYVYDGVTYILPVCNHVFEYNGGFKSTVESIGSDSESVSSVDSGVKTLITALKQNINALVRDLTQTQSKVTEIDGEVSKVTTLLQTMETIQSQVSKLEGDLETVSSVTQTVDQFKIDFQTLIQEANDRINENQDQLLSYFDFQPDALTIGVGSSDVKLKLAHNRIVFIKGSSEVAYLSDGQLYVTDAHFIHSLVLGNFEFTPRTNGNLSLRRRS